MTTIAKVIEVIFNTDEIQEQIARMQRELTQLRQDTQRLERERNAAIAKADFYYQLYLDQQGAQ